MHLPTPPVRESWNVVLLGLLLGLAPLVASGQSTLPFHRFTTHDGLPHESITALEQTPDGRLWIGTRTGLGIYDGHRFETVPFPDSLQSATVSDLQALPDGSVWVALVDRGALHVRNQQILRNVPALYDVNRLLARGDTLLAVTAAALWTLPPETSQFRKQPVGYDVKPPSMLENHPKSGAGLYDASFGSNGTLWVLDGRFGPGHVRPDGSITFEELRTSPDNRWRSLCIPPEGGFLMTRPRPAALLSYRPSREALRAVLTGLEGSNYVTCQESTAYVTDARGLQRFDLKARTSQRPLDSGLGLPRHLPTAVLEERSGTLWIGTQNGLLFLPVPTVRQIRTVKNLHLTNANRFMTANGELWTHTYGTGLVQLRPERNRVAPHGIDKWGQGVHSADGRMHALGEGNWYRRSPGETWRRIGPSHGAIRGYVDSRGTGYFWHVDGLYEHSPTASGPPHLLYGWPPEARGQHLIAPASNGQLYLRARSKLLTVDPAQNGPPQIDTVAHLPDAAEKAGRYMAASDAGDVWMAFGTGGLLHVSLKGQTPTSHFHLRHTSLRNVSLVGDSLALAPAKNGLFLIDVQADTVRHHLTSSDGLLSNYTSDATIHDDSLYTSHPAGLTILPRETAMRLPPVPQTSITGLQVNHEYRSIRDSLGLRASERTVDVEYAAPHFRNQQRVIFEYRLLPGDSTWRSTERPTRQFSSLEAGRHRFEVRARLGSVSGPATSLVLTIAPFFYETVWFWGLCGIGGLLLATGAYRWRLRSLQRQQTRLTRTVAERTHELRTAKTEVENQAQRLAELDTAKNRFFANLSHEFRTPLTLIIAPLRSLLRDSAAPVTEGVSKRLTLVLRNARRLERRISQLMTLSKLTAGRTELNRQSIDLVCFARHIYEAFVPLAERRGLTLEFRADVEQLPASVDPEKMEMVLDNLLSNALKYTEAGGTVWLTVASAPDAEHTAHLVVKDTGTGISEADLHRIFDRFEQVETDVSTEGVGIGLALTRDLVELHGGTVRVESEPETGSTFTVRLPQGSMQELVEPEAPPGEDLMPPQPPDVEESLLSPSGSAPHEDAPVLLAVDDNADVRTFLQRELGDQFQVDTVEDGAAALDRMHTSPPDVVVSDVMMPGIDGFALCEAIKSDDDLRSIPVVLLTARAEVDDALRGLDQGADEYVTKPFDVRELKRRIERLLEVRRLLQDEYAKVVQIDDVDLQVSEEDAAFIEAVLTTVYASLDDPDFTVDRLADAIALSRRQLSRRLRESIDEPPAALIRRLRLEHAARHLKDDDRPRISDLAHAVGYQSVSHFSTAFKKHFGCPPSAYPDQ